MVGVSCASVTRISKTTNFWNTPRTYMCIHVESSQLKTFFIFTYVDARARMYITSHLIRHTPTCHIRDTAAATTCMKSEWILSTVWRAPVKKP